MLVHLEFLNFTDTPQFWDDEIPRRLSVIKLRWLQTFHADRNIFLHAGLRWFKHHLELEECVEWKIDRTIPCFAAKQTWSPVSTCDFPKSKAWCLQIR